MRPWLPALLLIAQATVSQAAWEPDPGNRLEVAAARTMAEWRAADPSLEPFFAEACAVAVFPRILRVGLGAGYARGRGLLIAADRVTGEVIQSGLSLGVQAGGESHSQLIFFRTCEAVDLFTKSGNLGWVPGRLEFGGRASAAAPWTGVAADAAFSSDVAIFSRVRGGLMLQLAASGMRYRFTATDAAVAR